jgi:hypothetical protein
MKLKTYLIAAACLGVIGAALQLAPRQEAVHPWPAACDRDHSNLIGCEETPWVKDFLAEVDAAEHTPAFLRSVKALNECLRREGVPDGPKGTNGTPAFEKYWAVMESHKCDGESHYGADD